MKLLLALLFFTLTSTAQPCARNKQLAIKNQYYITQCDSLLAEYDSAEIEVYNTWVKYNRIDSAYVDSIFKHISQRKVAIKQFKEERTLALYLLWLDSALCPDNYWKTILKTK